MAVNGGENKHESNVMGVNLLFRVINKTWRLTVSLGTGQEQLIVCCGCQFVTGLYAGPNYCQSHMVWWTHGC